ncbi:MAG: hypothetical protein BWX99_01957 [Deltaproteobacteria bacterium ADurb.Bin151]|nr:MAG: hypothetical protein BWX99_01957 [Deltaproteobacteria bacterium ADurb.Bin151]
MKETTIIAPTTAISTPGILGTQYLNPRIMIRQERPMVKATQFVCPFQIPMTRLPDSVKKLLPLTVKPRTFGNWPISTVSAMPLRYPMRIGFDRRSVIKPNLARPAAMHSAPVKTASIPARDTALSALPAAKGTIVAAMIPASAESGPRTKMRLGPKMAYTIRGIMVA